MFWVLEPIMTPRHVIIALSGVACLSLGAFASHAQEDPSVVIGVSRHLSDGATALELGNYEEGIRLTMLGLKSSTRPRDRIGALSNLCAGYVGTQNYDEALRYCNRAIRLDPNNWRAYNNRGLAYLGLGNLEAARSDVERGFEINPSGNSLEIVAKLVEQAANAPAAAGSSASEEASSE
ncbi:MAG: tetratricopeptide repeat protein [Myxococcales bacterium]|nr:tetratricopeptide repeat protein [Myxococcales bacterium]